MLLGECGNLSFIEFSPVSNRFQVVSQFALSNPKKFTRQSLGKRLAVDPHGRAIAVAATENTIGIYPVIQKTDGIALANVFRVFTMTEMK